LLVALAIAQPQGNYSYVHHDGLTYSTSGNGIIAISINNRTVSNVGFVVTGIINEQSYVFKSNEFNWQWTKSEGSFIQEEVINDELENVSYDIVNFTSTNDNVFFVWNQTWQFNELYPTKITHVLTNNIGLNISNAKMWYVHTLERNIPITYNGISYTPNINNPVHLIGNFNDKNPKVTIGQFEFHFSDLVNSNFDITDVYIGDGTIIGYPDILIMGIGITKGNRLFEDGITIILDPIDTGFLTPDETGDPNDDWTNGDNIKLSDNVRSQVTVVGHLLDTSNYTFNIPDNSEILGIEIQLEGRSYAIFCPL